MRSLDAALVVIRARLNEPWLVGMTRVFYEDVSFLVGPWANMAEAEAWRDGLDGQPEDFGPNGRHPLRLVDAVELFNSEMHLVARLEVTTGLHPLPRVVTLGPWVMESAEEGIVVESGSGVVIKASQPNLGPLPDGVDEKDVLFRWVPSEVTRLNAPRHADLAAAYIVVQLDGRTDVMIWGRRESGDWVPNWSARFVVAHLLGRVS